MIKIKQCRCCGKSFQPNPHTWKSQKTCLKKACQKAWARQKRRRWASLHPDYSHSRKAKVPAWAKSYPDYWKHYRSTHPAHCRRDNAQHTVRMKGQRCSAKQTASDRRVDGILDYLIWTVNTPVSAKPIALAQTASSAVG